MQSTTGMEYSKILRFISESPVLRWGYCYSANHSGPQDGIGNGRPHTCQLSAFGFSLNQMMLSGVAQNLTLLNTFYKINMFLRKQWFFFCLVLFSRTKRWNYDFRAGLITIRLRPSPSYQTIISFQDWIKKRIKVTMKKYMRKYSIHSWKAKHKMLNV